MLLLKLVPAKCQIGPDRRPGEKVWPGDQSDVQPAGGLCPCHPDRWVSVRPSKVTAKLLTPFLADGVCTSSRLHLLHCGAALRGVAALHRTQFAKRRHDGPPAPQQRPLESPAIRSHTKPLPRRGAWGGRGRRRTRHPLIPLIFGGFLSLRFDLSWRVERKRDYPPPRLSSSVFELSFRLFLSLWDAETGWRRVGGWEDDCCWGTGSLLWGGGLRPRGYDGCAKEIKASDQTEGLTGDS